MDEKNTLEYLKAQERSRILTGVIIKLVLSVMGTIYLVKSMPLSFAGMIADALVFAMIYDLCCLFQFSLKITRNYIIGFFVFIAIVGGVLTLYNTVVEKYGFLNGNYTAFMEYVIVLGLIVVLLLPLILSIRRIIVLSRR